VDSPFQRYLILNDWLLRPPKAVLLIMLSIMLAILRIAKNDFVSFSAPKPTSAQGKAMLPMLNCAYN